MRYPIALACLMALATGASASPKAHAVAKMIGLDGKVMGRASLQATPHGTLIELELHGLSPGAHAVMVHTTASCDPKTLFTSAGPDLSFTSSKPHGYFAKGGPRAGDLPNQYAGADGVLHAVMFTSTFTLGNGKKSVFDRDGASLIVNQRGDDYMTQPDGNAGRRVACGPLFRTAGPAGRRTATQHKHK